MVLVFQNTLSVFFMPSFMKENNFTQQSPNLRKKNMMYSTFLEKKHDDPTFFIVNYSREFLRFCSHSPQPESQHVDPCIDGNAPKWRQHSILHRSIISATRSRTVLLPQSPSRKRSASQWPVRYELR
jgi:hypothetical protein